jgi:hypothetical protein
MRRPPSVDAMHLSAGPLRRPRRGTGEGGLGLLEPLLEPYPAELAVRAAGRRLHGRSGQPPEAPRIAGVRARRCRPLRDRRRGPGAVTGGPAALPAEARRMFRSRPRIMRDVLTPLARSLIIQAIGTSTSVRHCERVEGAPLVQQGGRLRAAPAATGRTGCHAHVIRHSCSSCRAAGRDPAGPVPTDRQEPHHHDSPDRPPLTRPAATRG